MFHTTSQVTGKHTKLCPVQDEFLYLLMSENEHNSLLYYKFLEFKCRKMNKTSPENERERIFESPYLKNLSSPPAGLPGLQLE